MGLMSLRDKLLQAGLVTQEQAKKAEADLEAKKKASRGRQGGPPQGRGKGPSGRPYRPNEGKPREKRELTEEEKRRREEEAAFREKERMLAKEREENRKRAIEDRKKLEGLRELCEKFEVNERGFEPFYFQSRKKKVLKIFLTPEQLKAIEAGELAIIDKPLPGEITTALVTREAAEKALDLDARAVRFYNRGNGETFGFKQEAPVEEPAGDSAESAEEPTGESSEAMTPEGDAGTAESKA